MLFALPPVRISFNGASIKAVGEISNHKSLSSTMRHALSSILICLLYLPAPGLCDPVDNPWKKLMFDGDNQSVGPHPKHQAAMEDYAKAAILAKTKNMPGKFSTSFCNQTREEVYIGNVQLADKHSEQVKELYKAAESNHTLDPELGTALLKLSEAYLVHRSCRLDCLERAFSLRWLVLSKNFPDSPELAIATFALSDYYDENNHPEKAIVILKQLDETSSKRLAQTLNFRAIDNLKTALAYSYELNHEYDQANKSESNALESARRHPEFYDVKTAYSNSFFAMNALAQKQLKESNDFFSKASNQSKKLKDDKEKQAYAIAGINQKLLKLAQKDKQDQRLELAEGEFKGLLEVEQALKADPTEQDLIKYPLFELLRAKQVASGKDNAKELEKYKPSVAVVLAKTPTNEWMKDAPTRSMRLNERRSGASTTYGKAIEAGHFYEANKRFDIALNSYLKALSCAESFGADSKEVVISLANIGYILVATNQIDRSRPYTERILGVAEKLKAINPPRRIDPATFTWVNDLSDRYHDYAIANRDLRESTTSYAYGLRMAITNDHDILASDIRELSIGRFEGKKYLPAAQAYECVVGHVQAKWGPTNLCLVPDLEKLADYEEVAKEYDKAVINLKRAIGICESKQDQATGIRLLPKLKRLEVSLNSQKKIQKDAPQNQK
jgi:tetratricopeptide (TPR) repeat protein